ncbi:uncharacterized protein LOC110733321 isoform X2 [Chenopodium quinoa]|uniref:uncharacterized protein LOC110733321 isoform X2 n=1 Tax=Chenopodium quinoa TaxID=63459 RepID=UPI000B78B836|nr:uncharacterized protein LOC110733321 isoform X2 [Chenopodium quinoa]
MAQVVKAAVTPLYHRQLLHFLSLQPPITATKTAAISGPPRLSLLSHRRNAHLKPRALRPPQQLDLLKDNRSKKISTNKSDGEDEADDDETSEDKKKKQRRSRNEMKRKARQTLHWGMDLASFSTPQIKRILKAASLEEDVFEALMVVKRLGSDVREGKRRQFNYIGRLLRDADAQPELLGALIQATKDGDQSTLQALAGSAKLVDEGPEEELHESESESEQEDEELRKLVRKVHSVQESLNSTEEDAEKSAGLIAAKKSLNRFLCSLAKRHSSAQNVDI